ncbi:MAG: TatD family hydrolase [Bacteroidia bacterium]|nr:TatD family hydrolase [Bacteroidia bacterium]
MLLTDSHTHLYAEEFDTDRDELLEKAVQSGVGYFCMPNIDSTSVHSMLSLEKRYPGRCFAMMGLHPCSVKENFREELNTVESWFMRRKFIAVGEIGLDLYWDKTFVREQEEAFLFQAALADRYRVPLVIHSRESFDRIADLLQSHPKLPPQGIFHCFTGTAAQAKRAIDLGFYLGIGGVLTFKNSGLDSVITDIPLERLVLETDAPYLAPAPYRGKRNIPEYLRLIAEKIASVKNVSIDLVSEVTTANAVQLFGLAPINP